MRGARARDLERPPCRGAGIGELLRLLSVAVGNGARDGEPRVCAGRATESRGGVQYVADFAAGSRDLAGTNGLPLFSSACSWWLVTGRENR
jgi:hypothetical protein